MKVPVMRKSHFTDERFDALRKEVEAGVQDLCRKHGISKATFYKWRSKNGDRALSEARRSKQPEEEKENWRVKQLEEENRRLRAIVADLTLSNETLKLAVAKKW
jgi:putative transposase